MAIALLVQQSLQSYCMTFHRYDVMQEWNVKSTSRLCRVSGVHTSFGDQYVLEARGDALTVRSKDYSRDLDSNWITEKGKYDHSVSLIRDGISYPHFFSIVETDDKGLIGKFEHSSREGIRAVRRSIYYVSKDEIDTDGTSGIKIIWAVLCTVYGVFGILAVMTRIMNFALPLMVVLAFVISLVTGLWLITTYWGVLVLVAVTFVVGVILSIINWKFFKSLGSIGFGLLMMAYYFIGSPYEYMVGFAIAFGLLLIVSAVFAYFMPTLMMVKKLKFIGLHFSFWFCQYLFWSYIFYIYPAEIFLRANKGPRDYDIGVQGKGITIYWPMIVSIIVVMAMSILSGFIAKNRLSRIGYGPDSAATDSRPLI